MVLRDIVREVIYVPNVRKVIKANLKLYYTRRRTLRNDRNFE